MNDTLHQKFFSDPDWKLVEQIFIDRLTPFTDLSTIDTSQPAEHVKAELIARSRMHDYLTEVLNDSVLITRKLEKKPNPFR